MKFLDRFSRKENNERTLESVESMIREKLPALVYLRSAQSSAGLFEADRLISAKHAMLISIGTIFATYKDVIGNQNPVILERTQGDRFTTCLTSRLKTHPEIEITLNASWSTQDITSTLFIGIDRQAVNKQEEFNPRNLLTMLRDKIMQREISIIEKQNRLDKPIEVYGASISPIGSCKDGCSFACYYNDPQLREVIENLFSLLSRKLEEYKKAHFPQFDDYLI